MSSTQQKSNRKRLIIKKKKKVYDFSRCIDRVFGVDHLRGRILAFNYFEIGSHELYKFYGSHRVLSNHPFYDDLKKYYELFKRQLDLNPFELNERDSKPNSSGALIRVKQLTGYGIKTEIVNLAGKEIGFKCRYTGQNHLYRDGFKINYKQVHDLDPETVRFIIYFSNNSQHRRIKSRITAEAWAT